MPRHPHLLTYQVQSSEDAVEGWNDIRTIPPKKWGFACCINTSPGHPLMYPLCNCQCFFHLASWHLLLGSLVYHSMHLFQLMSLDCFISPSSQSQKMTSLWTLVLSITPHQGYSQALLMYIGRMEVANSHLMIRRENMPYIRMILTVLLKMHHWNLLILKTTVISQYLL